MIELERIVVRLVGEAESYHKMLDEADKGTTKLVDQFAKLAAAAALIDTVFKKSVNEFSKFDLAMTESTSIMKVTEEQTERMKQTALELSGKSIHGPAELAKAFYHLASAGYDVEQSIALLPAVSRFATAGAFNLEYATILAAGSQGALGLRVQNATKNMESLVRITDVLTKANNLEAGSAQDFANALSRSAGATLKSYNKEMEEGVAVLMVYASQNLKGKTAGEHLGRLLRQLAGTASTAAQAHKDLGFSVFDNQGQFKNLADIVENLEQIMKGLNDEGKSMKLEALGFKSLHQKAILPLIGTSAQIRKYEQQLRMAGGTTQSVADKQMSAFSNQMAAIKNQVTVAAISIGEQLAPAFKLVADTVSYLLAEWGKLPTATKAGIVTIGLLITGFVGLTAAITLAGTVFNLMFGGIGIGMGLLAVGVVAAGAGFGALVEKFGSVAAVMQELKIAAMKAWEWLIPVRQALVSFFVALWKVALQTWKAIENTAVAVWEMITGNIEMSMEDVRSAIVDGILMAEFAISNFGKVWEVVWAGIKYYTVVTLNAILNNLFLILVGGPALAILTAFGSNWEAVFKGIWDYMVQFAKAFGELHLRMWENIKKGAKGEKTDWRTVFGDIHKGMSISWKGVKIDGLDDLEKRLKDEFDSAKGKLGKDFLQFRADKLAEFAKDLIPKGGAGLHHQEEEGEKAGEEITKGMTKGIKDNMKDVDAVLFRSAGALRRIMEYRESISNPDDTTGKSKFGREVNIKPYDPKQKTREAQARADEIRAKEHTELLKRIADAAEKGAGKEPVKIDVAP